MLELDHLEVLFNPGHQGLVLDVSLLHHTSVKQITPSNMLLFKLVIIYFRIMLRKRRLVIQKCVLLIFLVIIYSLYDKILLSAESDSVHSSTVDSHMGLNL